MARARNIKPGFFKNADLVELTMEARLLFIGLWTLADRAGRLEDRPKQIKMELFPADSVDVDECLEGLKNWKFIARYQVASLRLIQVLNFHKHQNPHRDERVSVLPAQDGTFDEAPKKHGANTVQAPCEEAASTVAIGLIPDSLNLIPDSGLLSEDATPRGDGHTLPTMAAAVCVALKATGIGAVIPSHQGLQDLLQQGADIGSFVQAGKAAVERGKGTFAYVLGMVKGQMADAANLAATANSRAPPLKETDYQRSMREKMEIVAPSIAARRPTQQTGVIDGTARRLGGSDIYEVDPDIRARLPEPLGRLGHEGGQG